MFCYVSSYDWIKILFSVYVYAKLLSYFSSLGDRMKMCSEIYVLPGL